MSAPVLSPTFTGSTVFHASDYGLLRQRALEMQRAAGALVGEIDRMVAHAAAPESSVRISIRPTPMEVAVEVARIFNLQVPTLLGKCRARTIVDARHSAFWFAYVLSGQSMNQVGIGLGGFNHVTVIHGARKAEILYGSDTRFRLRHEAIEKELCGIFRMKANPSAAIHSPTRNFSPL